ncbi:E3 ubiquitin-protein ligase MIB2-like [Patiria miniata]|uniref:RING-type E3 ubiquitin transferase n=1 Tax=Patiria miniata TaxID=46514 RepID=A0A914AE00_PATMI|nr:E3 ubiquitin-protein ligase MIB2-like [Patiria miniata]
MSIGVRVVRGPDWKWGDQDGGKGCVGTVVPAESSQSAKGVWVRWDSGRKANYRPGGEKGTYDLRIYDNAQLGVKHPHINCDCCPEEGIVGIRWKCLECHDFDLCHSCYNKGKHDLGHRFTRIETNSVPGVEVPCRLSVTKCRSLGIFPGARVVRGPDWEWGDQDGGEGKIGTVKEVIGAQGTHRSWVKVQWPNRSTNQYRRGHGGKLDVQYTQEDTAGEFYMEHLPRLVRPDFDSGDKVRLLDIDPGILKELQKYRGKVGEVIVVDKDGDVKVNFGGASFFINPLCLAMEKKKGAEDTKAGAGELNAVELLASLLSKTKVDKNEELRREPDERSSGKALFNAAANGDTNKVREILMNHPDAGTGRHGSASTVGGTLADYLPPQAGQPPVSRMSASQRLPASVGVRSLVYCVDMTKQTCFALDIVNITRTYHSANCQGGKVRVHPGPSSPGLPKHDTTVKWNATKNANCCTAMSTFGKNERPSKDWFNAYLPTIEPEIEAKREAFLLHKRCLNKHTLAALRSTRSTTQRTHYSLLTSTGSNCAKKSSESGNVCSTYRGIKKALGPAVKGIAPDISVRRKDHLCQEKRSLTARNKWPDGLSTNQICTPVKRQSPTLPSVVQRIIPIIEELDEVPTMEDLSKTIDSLSDDKAPGIDNIPPKAMKHGKSALPLPLYELLCLCGKKVQIDNVVLEDVDEFTYLISTFSNNVSLDVELDRRLGKTNTILARLTTRVWENEALTGDIKIRVYQACVLSTLLYENDSWTIFIRFYISFHSYGFIDAAFSIGLYDCCGLKLGEVRFQNDKRQTALHAAVLRGHVDAVNVLALGKVPLEHPDEAGDTALSYAVHGNKPDIIKTLLLAGSNINAANNKGLTPLHLASQKGHQACAEALLMSPKCDVNYQNSDGDSPLFLAIHNNNTQIIHLLINHQRTDLRQVNKKGFSSLHHAVFCQNSFAVGGILRKSPSMINVTTSTDNFTALHIAALNGLTEITLILVKQANCNKELKTIAGQTALHMAIDKTNNKCIEALVNNGANVNAQDGDGDTSLHLVMMKASMKDIIGTPLGQLLQLVQQLGDEGSSSDEKSNLVAIAVYLIKNDADIYITNKKGQNVLDVTLNPGVKKLLRDHYQRKRLAQAMKNSPDVNCKVS